MQHNRHDLEYLVTCQGTGGFHREGCGLDLPRVDALVRIAGAALGAGRKLHLLFKHGTLLHLCPEFWLTAPNEKLETWFKETVSQLVLSATEADGNAQIPGATLLQSKVGWTDAVFTSRGVSRFDLVVSLHEGSGMSCLDALTRIGDCGELSQQAAPSRILMVLGGVRDVFPSEERAVINKCLRLGTMHQVMSLGVNAELTSKCIKAVEALDSIGLLSAPLAMCRSMEGPQPTWEPALRDQDLRIDFGRARLPLLIVVEVHGLLSDFCATSAAATLLVDVFIGSHVCYDRACLALRDKCGYFLTVSRESRFRPLEERDAGSYLQERLKKAKHARMADVLLEKQWRRGTGQLLVLHAKESAPSIKALPRQSDPFTAVAVVFSKHAHTEVEMSQLRRFSPAGVSVAQASIGSSLSGPAIACMFHNHGILASSIRGSMQHRWNAHFHTARCSDIRGRRQEPSTTARDPHMSSSEPSDTGVRSELSWADRARALQVASSPSRPDTRSAVLTESPQRPPQDVGRPPDDERLSWVDIAKRAQITSATAGGSSSLGLVPVPLNGASTEELEKPSRIRDSWDVECSDFVACEDGGSDVGSGICELDVQEKVECGLQDDGDQQKQLKHQGKVKEKASVLEESHEGNERSLKDMADPVIVEVCEGLLSAAADAQTETTVFLASIAKGSQHSAEVRGSSSVESPEQGGAVDTDVNLRAVDTQRAFQMCKDFSSKSVDPIDVTDDLTGVSRVPNLNEPLVKLGEHLLDSREDAVASDVRLDAALSAEREKGADSMTALKGVETPETVSQEKGAKVTDIPIVSSDERRSNCSADSGVDESSRLSCKSADGTGHERSRTRARGCAQSWAFDTSDGSHVSASSPTFERPQDTAAPKLVQSWLSVAKSGTASWQRKVRATHSQVTRSPQHECADVSLSTELIDVVPDKLDVRAKTRRFVWRTSPASVVAVVCPESTMNGSGAEMSTDVTSFSEPSSGHTTCSASDTSDGC
mmetsp:Transcript_26022/g.68316  ORF Transcript_26022/g.68316 Transcript_26022/m.68316 type:complete len:994 (-) Transcript_26022:131-3112(-)